MNTPDVVYYSPLHAACDIGDTQTANLLITNGANVNHRANNGVTPLYVACQNGHQSAVQLLLSSNADVHLATSAGQTPLWVACSNGHVGVVRLLLSAGANVNAIQPTDGTTALSEACKNGYIAVVQSLISAGADTNTPRHDGISPLMIACFLGFHGIVLLLLSSGSDVNTGKTTTGATALFLACQRGHVKIVQILLSSGADANKSSAYGKSPLFIASQKGHACVAELLLSAGANNNVLSYNGISPLWIACQEGHINTVKCLLLSGANVNTSPPNGISPLAIACDQGHIHIVKLLLSKSPNVNASRTTDGSTALYIACQNGHLEVVRLLLSSGADVHRPCDNGTCPLHIASEEGHHGILLLLLSSGVDVNTPRTTDNATALYFASQNGHLEAVRLLLASDANTDRPLHDGVSPLLIAIKRGNLDIAELLLSSGADVNASDYEGESPLWAACDRGYVTMARLLLPSVTDINSVKTKHKATSLYIACQSGNSEVVKLLVSSGADVNRTANNGVSPLIISIQNGYHSVVELLLSCGANVNQLSDHALSPLYVACLHSNLEMVQLLCDAGADTNDVRPTTGATPLYSACSHGQLEVVQFFLAQHPQLKCKSVADNMSDLHAYSLSLCQLEGQSEKDIHLFIQNFAALLFEFKSIFEMSDHFTTVLDMMLLARNATCPLIDTLVIEKLGYIMAMAGTLNDPLYIILPETKATQGNINESYSLHTTLSALIDVLDTKAIGILLTQIKSAYSQKQFLQMCKCLLHQNILHVIAQKKNRNNKNRNDESVESKAQLFLDHGVDVWAKDINGRLPLHIACMMGNARLAHNFLKAMLQAKAFAKDPKMLNFQVVYCRQNYSSTSHDLGEFCRRFRHILMTKPDIYRTQMLDNVGMLPIDYCNNSPSGNIEEFLKLPGSIQPIVQGFSDELTLSQLQSLEFGNVSNDDMKQLLYLPPCGKVLITEENELIFSSVMKLVRIICDCIGHQDPLFLCTPVLSGSVYEKTKTTRLDEFDVCVKLLHFDAIAQTDVEVVHATLLAMCIPSTSSMAHQYWRAGPDGQLTFAGTLFCSRFWQLLLKAMELPVVSKYLEVSRIIIDDCKRKSGFVGTLYITWYGNMYPCLPISVDLVPLVELKDYYCLLRPRYFEHKTIGPHLTQGLELSCNKKDKCIMISLSKIQKDAYCLAKVIRGLAKSFISESGRTLTSDQVIQSYLMKTTLMWIVDPKEQFHEYYPDLNKDLILESFVITRKPTPSSSHILEVRNLAGKIFALLKYMLENDRQMHTYNMPLCQFNVVCVRDKDLAIALCDKCIRITWPSSLWPFHSLL